MMGGPAAEWQTECRATATGRMASRAPRSEGPSRADPARVAGALGRAVSRDLPAVLPRQRWFGDKGRSIAAVNLRDCGAFGDRAWLVLVTVAFTDGVAET